MAAEMGERVRHRREGLDLHPVRGELSEAGVEAGGELPELAPFPQGGL